MGVRKLGPHLGDKGALFFVLADQSVISCKCIAGSWARRVVQACSADLEQTEKLKAALQQIADIREKNATEASDLVLTAVIHIAQGALKEFG